MTEASTLTRLRGTAFAKLTGSGNDFVFFDGRVANATSLVQPDVVVAICNRHNGIGADGIVILEPSDIVRHGQSSSAPVRIRYFNSNGTPADLCGNATLCSTVMAAEYGLTAPGQVEFDTPAGPISARIIEGVPRIDLPPVGLVVADRNIALDGGESRMGFTVVGVPHLVVLCADADRIELNRRGTALRHHPENGPPGANVNFVSRLTEDTWRYRTFERGVEGETLACGTGAVATAVLLQSWGLGGAHTRVRATSGCDLEVFIAEHDGEQHPSLQGEGRVVFRGHIGDLA